LSRGKRGKAYLVKGHFLEKALEHSINIGASEKINNLNQGLKKRINLVKKS
jgi:hypothetical protein